MEGIGSRTGRPSSRYGSAPVFTGPVRKWHKQWVNISSSSSSSSTSYNHTNSSNSNVNNNNNNNGNNDVSAIRIRRWTPVPSVQSGGESETVGEERPKRKLRYAPIVVLEGRKKEAEKGGDEDKEASKTKQSPAQETSENDDSERKSSDNVLAAKSQSGETTKDLNNRPMDLDTGGDDDDDFDDEEDHDLGGQESG